VETVWCVINVTVICLVFVERLCKLSSEQSSGDGDFRLTSNWKPLVLIVPLRLGLNEINPVYVQGLKVRTTLTVVLFRW
jgi:cysteine protease ATG4